jgi:hypothetical protein
MMIGAERGGCAAVGVEVDEDFRNFVKMESLCAALD